MVKICQSGRRKKISGLLIFNQFILFGLIVFVTLLVLTLYTPWVNQKSYNKNKDILEKNWLANPLPILLNSLPGLFKNSYASIINLIVSKVPSPDSKLPTVRIFLKNNGLEELNRDILQYHLGELNKKPRVKGFYQDKQGKLIEMKVGLRGLSTQHHQVSKPSLRIRFTNKRIVDGFRNHILIIPKYATGLRNWLSIELSKKWGMLIKDLEFVRLFINNKYFGLYNRTWRLDESLLIRNNLLPGPFFRLEPSDKRLFFVGNYPWWYIPNGWEVKGIPQQKGHSLLNKTIKIAQEIVGWTPRMGRSYLVERINQLNEMIDQNVFSKYLALLCHSGETHVDAQHNNAFWLDTTSGKLLPILVDVTGYSLDQNSLHRQVLRADAGFVRSWLMDPRNLAQYIDRLDEMNRTLGSAESVEKTIRKQWKNIKPDAMADLFYSRASSYNGFLSLNQMNNKVKDIIEFVKIRNQWVQEQLNKDRLYLVHSYGDQFEVLVEGLVGFEIYRRDSSLTNGKQKAFLLPTYSTFEKNFLYSPVPKAYAFYKLFGKPSDYVFLHRLSRKKTEFYSLSPPPNLKQLRVFEGITMQEISGPQEAPAIYGPGDVVFKKTKVFSLGQPVVILPATNIHLGPGVSLIIKGPLMVKGTEENPVIIRPLFENKPFGVVALLGEGTKGSHIKNLDLAGGSTQRYFNINFTGMLSVHDNPDIQIRNSRFGKNFFGDDAVHIVRSKALIENSFFENSFMDALDWDKVDGEIRGVTFVNSINDSVDLSMGQVKISGSSFTGCSDKCISAGEGAKVIVKDTEFRDCNVGIAVKDSSTFELDGGEFNNCQVGWESYKKKWRWEKGGKGRIMNTNFNNSRTADIKGDELSSVEIIGSDFQNLKIDGKIKVKINSNKNRES